MHRFKFTPDDLFINRLKTYPEYNTFIYQGQIYVNKEHLEARTGLVVYDINRNKIPANSIQPYVVSSSLKTAFKTRRFQPLVKQSSDPRHLMDISKLARIHEGKKDATYDTSLVAEPTTTIATTLGLAPSTTALTSSYSLGSKIKRNLTSRESSFVATYYDINVGTIRSSQTRPHEKNLNMTASALQNIARKYTVLSDHFILTGSNHRAGLSRNLVYGTAADNLNFITIPSMYYGSSIKKGSVELNYYLTGSKVASCADINHNGTLIGTSGSTSGSVVGLVMYDEGIIMLTSSTTLETGGDLDIRYLAGGTAARSSWQQFGTGLNDGIAHTSLSASSYDLNFLCVAGLFPNIHHLRCA